MGPADFVVAPTAVAVFHQFIDDGRPLCEWAQRLHNVISWTPMPRGGHFAAFEVPELPARDIAAFFSQFRLGEQVGKVGLAPRASATPSSGSLVNSVP